MISEQTYLKLVVLGFVPLYGASVAVREGVLVDVEAALTRLPVSADLTPSQSSEKNGCTAGCANRS